MLKEMFLVERIRWFVFTLMGLVAFSGLHCQSSTDDENNSNDNGTACNAPANLTATAVSDSRIRLVWQHNCDEEAGFRIERGLSSGASVTIAVLDPDATSYDDIGLEALMTYYYRVSAIYTDAESQYTDEALATTLAAAAPTCTLYVDDAGGGDQCTLKVIRVPWRMQSKTPGRVM
jgi:hypothetical protein